MKMSKWTRLCWALTVLASFQPKIVLAEEESTEAGHYRLITDKCHDEGLTHAASSAANWICKERMMKAIPDFDCSSIRFEVIHATTSHESDKYEGTIALTNKDGKCLIGFDSQFTVPLSPFGATPEMEDIVIKKCSSIQYAGDCNHDIESEEVESEEVESSDGSKTSDSDGKSEGKHKTEIQVEEGNEDTERQDDAGKKEAPASNEDNDKEGHKDNWHKDEEKQEPEEIKKVQETPEATVDTASKEVEEKEEAVKHDTPIHDEKEKEPEEDYTVQETPEDTIDTSSKEGEEKEEEAKNDIEPAEVERCHHEELSHAASRAAHWFCTERMTLALPDLDCSQVRFEVIRATDRVLDTGNYYEGTIALTNQQGDCLIAFGSHFSIPLTGEATPEISDVSIKKCDNVEYVGDCNQDFEPEPSGVEEAYEDKTPAKEEKEEEIIKDDVEEKEEEIAIKEDVKEDEVEAILQDEQNADDTNAAGAKNNSTEGEKPANLESESGVESHTATENSENDNAKADTPPETKDGEIQEGINQAGTSIPQEATTSGPSNNETVTDMNQMKEAGASESNVGFAELAEPESNQATELASVDPPAQDTSTSAAAIPAFTTAEPTVGSQTATVSPLEENSPVFPLVNVNNSGESMFPSKAPEAIGTDTTAGDSTTAPDDFSAMFHPVKTTAAPSSAAAVTIAESSSASEDFSAMFPPAKTMPESTTAAPLSATAVTVGDSSSVQENPAFPQSNSTLLGSAPEKTPTTDQSQETAPETPQANLIGVHDGDDEDVTPKNGEAGDINEAAFQDKLKKEKEMAEELEEDEASWNFAGRTDECSRFGVSPSEGIVFVCDTTAYVCGEGMQFRERFLLLLEDPIVDGCDLGDVSKIYSAKADCDFFPKNEHHLKRDGKQEEQVVLCPNGSVLSSYYMFCSQELNNYFCDGDACETCEEVSRRKRKFLRH